MGLEFDFSSATWVSVPPPILTRRASHFARQSAYSSAFFDARCLEPLKYLLDELIKTHLLL